MSSKNIIENPDWWKGAAIYQIYPRSFNDSNNDGIGDLQGIIEKLPYIASLGVDAIWLSPFFTSPQKDFGYDISDYCDINPQYGTLADFDCMVKVAHEHGLKVVIDQVYSHTSDEHVWFEESRKDKNNPKADWYVWADPKPDGTAPNNWLSFFGGIAWKFEPARRQYYLHNFHEGQPDLNLHNSEVQDAVLDTTRFWLKRGVDGFRLDAIAQSFHDPELKDNPADPKGFNSYDTRDWQDNIYTCDLPQMDDWVKRIRSVMDEYQGTTTVGEISDVYTVARYTSPEGALHMGYSFELMDRPLTVKQIKENIKESNDAMKAGWHCVAMSNHDRKRVVTREAVAGVDRATLAKLYLTLLGTLRGSLCLYQGEELGLPEAKLQFEDLIDPWGLSTWPEDQGRDGCRTPMPWHSNEAHGGFSENKPWLPMQSFHLPLAVDKQEYDHNSVLNFTRKLMPWRKEHMSFITGRMELMDIPGEILGYRRISHSGDEIICLFNMGSDEADIILPGDILNNQTPAGFTSTTSANVVHLPPWQAAVVQL